MINLDLLKREIKDSGLKQSYIAEQLGLSSYGLSKKLKGNNEFKLSEITRLSKLLKFTVSKRNKVFFG